MSHQNPLTLICPIKPERLQDLYGYLSGLKYALEKGKHSLFEKSNSIHYLRWIVIDDKNSFFFKGTERNPKLVFSSNFDGSVEQHLKDLCSNHEEKLIDRLYECCEGYPEINNRTLESRTGYLKKYKVKVSAFYKGSVRRSLPQIRKETELRKFLRDTLDTNNWENLSAKEVHTKLKDIVSKSEFNWAKEPFKMPKNNWFKL